VYSFGLIFVFFSITPILWGLSTALKLTKNQYSFPPQWIPRPITFDHFIAALNNKAVIHGFVNTLIIAVSTTIIALIVGVLGAYGFSRYRFPGRKTLLWSVLFTQLFPRVVVIVPFFVTLRNLNLMNTLPGLVLVYLMVIFPISIWMIKGFFDRIPVEIEEAAVVDGCSTAAPALADGSADVSSRARGGGHVFLYPCLERILVRPCLHTGPGQAAALGRSRLLHRRDGVSNGET